MRRLFILFLWLVLNFSSERHTAPLATAAFDGNTEQIRLLAARGADPNEPSGQNGWTPLMFAIHKNQIAAVAALLDARANPNVAAGGMTPLMMAAGYGQAATVRLLIARGAKPRLQNRRGETALDYALTGMNDIDDFTLFRCQDETARALIAAGAHARPLSIRFAKLKGCVTP